MDDNLLKKLETHAMFAHDLSDLQTVLVELIQELRRNRVSPVTEALLRGT